MLPDTLGEKWREGGQSAFTILGGRVGTSITSFRRIAVTSVPYPFCSQMAKVQLKIVPISKAILGAAVLRCALEWTPAGANDRVLILPSTEHDSATTLTSGTNARGS